MKKNKHYKYDEDEYKWVESDVWFWEEWIVAIVLTACVYPLVIAVCGWLLWISIVVLPFVICVTLVRRFLD